MPRVPPIITCRWHCPLVQIFHGPFLPSSGRRNLSKQSDHAYSEPRFRFHLETQSAFDRDKTKGIRHHSTTTYTCLSPCLLIHFEQQNHCDVVGEIRKTFIRPASDRHIISMSNHTKYHFLLFIRSRSAEIDADHE